MLAPIVLSAGDFVPLFKDPKYMDGCIAALERAFVDYHHRRLRTGSLVEDASADGKTRSLRFNLVYGQGSLDSILARGAGGGNSRSTLLFDAATRELLALLDSGLLNPLRVGAEAGVTASTSRLGARLSRPAPAPVSRPSRRSPRW